MFEKAHDILMKCGSFFITTHVNPEGDAIGSEIAFAEFLEAHGKKVFIVNSSPTPDNLLFLDEPRRVRHYVPNYSYEWTHSIDAAVVLDVGDFSRVGAVNSLISLFGKPIVCIDHHEKNKQFGDIEVIDPTACSTGLILFRYFEWAGWRPSSRACMALYTSILTDTGGFSHSNTSPESMRASAQLIEAGGFDPSLLYDTIYKTYAFPRLKLMGKFLNSLQLECDGRLAVSVVTQNMLVETGAAMADTDGFTDYPFEIKGVCVSLLFKELGSNRTKISLRAKGAYDVFEIALPFGGGGHRHAAGILLEKNLDESLQCILSTARDYISGKRTE